MFGRTIEGRNQLKRVNSRNTQPLAPSWGEYLPDFRPLSIGKVLHSETNVAAARSLFVFAPVFLSPVPSPTCPRKIIRKPFLPKRCQAPQTTRAEACSPRWGSSARESCARARGSGQSPGRSRGRGAFIHKAIALGFVVAKPYGHNHPYDFIVGRGSGFRSVQIKACAAMWHGLYQVCISRHRDVIRSLHRIRGRFYSGLHHSPKTPGMCTRCARLSYAPA